MVTGICMVRDEADIIGTTIAHMLEQVDHVIVADNGSVDDTREILESFDVTIVNDPVVAYYQSAKMSRLAWQAACDGADWVVRFDADESWYSPFGRIADVLEGLDAAIATAAIYDHRPSGIDPAEGSPVDRIGWRTREPIPLHKVACRPILPVTIHQGNHAASYRPPSTAAGQLVIRHFPIRSVEQMIRKARNGGQAYAATDLPEEAGDHWRSWNRLTDEHLDEVFHQYYWFAEPGANPDLIFDPVPCRLPS